MLYSVSKSTFVTTSCERNQSETTVSELRYNGSERITKDSFTQIKVIGRGSYARVFLVQKNDTGDLYAMKVLKKSKIYSERSKSRVKIERDIMMSIRHPFIVNLYY